MRKFFLGFAALLLMYGVAQAGWNIKQNADGTTSWINSESEQFQIGRTYLTLHLDAVGTPATRYISVPFAGSIALVDAVVHGAVTGTTETITVSIMSVASPGDQFLGITTNNTITLASTIVNSTGQIVLGGVGDYNSSGAMVGKASDADTANEQISGQPTVSAGGAIAISTAGASSSVDGATIIIHYDRDQSRATFR